MDEESKKGKLFYSIGEVATMLYYAALGVGLVRFGARITGLDPAALDDGFRWALEQPWLPGELRGLFVEVQRSLG